MIRRWINKKLTQRLDKKKHEVLKLQWEKANLEKQLEELKKEKTTE